MRMGGARFFLATSLLALAASAEGGETVDYSYDSLGRLTDVSRSGTANDPSTAHYRYDPADNRLNVTVVATPPTQSSVVPLAPALSSLATSAALSTAAGNLPPVAVDDSAAIRACDRLATFLPLANDRDPDGDSPLVLVEVAYSGALGNAIADGPRILFVPTGLGTGTASIAYRIADSEGASATGTFTLSVAPGPCS